MSIAVFLVLVAPAALLPLMGARAGRFLADQLRPTWSVAVLTGALVGFAAVTVAGLALLAAVAVSEWEPALVSRTWSLAALIGGREEVTAPLGVALGVLASLGLGIVAVRVALAVRGVSRRYRWAGRQIPPDVGPGSVIEAPEAGVPARALPVRGGHILVDARLWAGLPDRHRDAVLAHERAHLRRHHDRHLVVAALACACNPLLGPLARALDYALERSADEDAARTCDRRTVAHAIGAVALVGRPDRPVLAATGAAVPRRVGALLDTPHTTWRGAATAVGVLLTLVASVGLAHHAWVDLLEILATR
ncbi:hypothetical protein GCM10023201_52510 [Actinomycetospora corticicola]|uniref:Peptidase M48-like protein n=1 Tax=Actinomycetospora corticicola TaxID=663602 RepID=A0A7Y9DYD4_9PSEU|nr:M56 family peptidase [Actinomycetospora corticicola]NYD37487.1 hypothetical protein [Actinomycetospora corticicola]